jgi:hypothetical protein
VNAIDDQLKGAKQISIRYDLANIPTLRSLLAHAAAHERAVLLTSDHGHVAGDLLESKGPPTNSGGARWRPLREGNAPAPYEVVLSGKNVWIPKGYDRVAVIWDDRSVYGSPGVGEHGGISLAESLCPALLVAPESLALARGGSPDEALRSVRRYEPAWWRFDAAPLEVVETPAPVPVTRPKKASKPQGELFASPLPSPQAPVAAPSAAPRPRHALADKLAKTTLFKAQAEGRSVEKVQLALEHLSLLLDAGAQMSVDDFARRANVPVFRASGPILDLQSLLNIEGYQVVEYDRMGKQVRLNRQMLLQTFELEGAT